MLESHNPYQWIRLPISRAWRLEVGKHQVWRWSWGEFMLRTPRPSSPADMSLCMKPIGLEGIMTLRRFGSWENTHIFTLMADPDTHIQGILKEYLIALNNCILAPTQVHAPPQPPKLRAYLSSHQVCKTEVPSPSAYCDYKVTIMRMGY